LYSSGDQDIRIKHHPKNIAVPAARRYFAKVNFRIDEELKSGMERACREMGMSMTTAFTIFAAKVIPSCNQKIATWYDAAGCRRGVERR
jgi:hypothetical protein